MELPLPEHAHDLKSLERGVPQAFDNGRSIPKTGNPPGSAPIPAIRATALFVPDHLPAAYVCAYYSLLIFVRGQAKR